MNSYNQFFVKPRHGKIGYKSIIISQFKSNEVGFQFQILKIATNKVDSIWQFQYGGIRIKILKLAHFNLFLILNYRVYWEKGGLSPPWEHEPLRVAACVQNLF